MTTEKTRISLHIPKVLALRLEKLAASEKRSLNAQLTLMLEQALTPLDAPLHPGLGKSLNPLRFTRGSEVSYAAPEDAA